MDIAVDFDGTCVSHEFPNIGQDIGATPILKRLVQAGHNLILFTMRSNGGDHGDVLDAAVEWFEERDIPLYGIQSNPHNNWSDSPKAYANIYIDDSALGVPLTNPPQGRPYVDWELVERELIDRGVLGEQFLPGENLQEKLQ